ncbi:hypothetical protein KFZ76_07455 [Methylovulum psychrotolerans]|uniref:transposase n=1 Tax=Methylovulum psychrotolerans TaxID=1704499 RepID=UPI001BFF937C|nr:transposase [Methylovulum psychrotolerans]MBT9097541.1 hypothetical protein [Methylovulum psychrotolerans]
MDKWRGQYRIQSTRLQHYDYTSNGAYFITICTHLHKHHFGMCNDGQMQFSTIGAIAQGFWYEIPKHFSSVTLAEFVVMPNHLHGILILERPTVETLHCNVYQNDITQDNSLAALSAKNEFFSKISPKANSVSTIIRSYKSVCKKHIHHAFPDHTLPMATTFL